MLIKQRTGQTSKQEPSTAIVQICLQSAMERIKI